MKIDNDKKSHFSSPQIKIFFSASAYAVIGASSNRNKFGNKVLRCYMQHQKKVYPVNPQEKIIEGLDCINDIEHLPDEVKSISVITPPMITEKIVDQAIKHGIRNIWMQPGAESSLAVKECRDNGVNVIAGGPCILIELGFKE